MKSLLYQIRAHKLAYALNVLGLSIALAAFYLFATQVEFNRTYNHSVKDHERTYRLEVGGFTKNQEWSCYMIRFFESSMKGMTHVEDVVSHNMVQWRLPVFVNGNLFLDNLLIDCNSLIISAPKISESAKETNWKQKLPKTPSCKQEITKINVENNGKLQFSECRSKDLLWLCRV